MAYVPVTELEFDQVLKKEKGWEKIHTQGTKEIIYVFKMKTKPFTVKVYSSITESNGVSRGCGKDAIRVCAINHETNSGAAKTRRINRVPGWEDRLVKKVTELCINLKNRW